MALKRIAVRSMIVLFPAWALAGDDRHESKALPQVTNEVYRTYCGSCHFAYQPGLLPARSWLKIVDVPGGHAGGDVPLDEKTKTEIRRYLTANSAEYAGSKRSRKILASLDGGVPTRISEVPYIREKHHELGDELFLRTSVKSRGNCIACHSTAERGDYDDDGVTIPK